MSKSLIGKWNPGVKSIDVWAVCTIMGAVDIEILMEINEEIKKHGIYSFKVDHGEYQTGLEFWEIGYYHPPKSKSWEEAKAQGNTIKCPDLLDITNKRIIEFEEESKPGKKGGKLGKKGHTEESKRDSNRDYLYRISGFNVLKIWETDYLNGTWKEKLYNFLNNQKQV